MIFKDRTHAAQLLAKQLTHYRSKNTVVMAIPRGGVPLGKVIAEYLHTDLDVVMIKKIRHPNNPEYAIGAVSLKDAQISPTEVPISYIEKQIVELRAVLRRKFAMYREQLDPIDLENKIVIIVDDGLATGSSAKSAISWVRGHDPQSIVLAVPVAPPQTLKEIKPLVDDLICLHAPTGFGSVGRYYYNFAQVSDKQAVALLKSFNLIKKNDVKY